MGGKRRELHQRSIGARGLRATKARMQLKIMKYCKDGGYASTVSGLFIVEIKNLFSIVLLRFDPGSRDAFHSHAFNCFSWLLSGHLIERHITGEQKTYRPSWLPFVTRRDTFHKVVSDGTSVVLSFRGPWATTWREFIPNEQRTVTLTNGRREVR